MAAIGSHPPRHHRGGGAHVDCLSGGMRHAFVHFGRRHVHALPDVAQGQHTILELHKKYRSTPDTANVDVHSPLIALIRIQPYWEEWMPFPSDRFLEPDYDYTVVDGDKIPVVNGELMLPPDESETTTGWGIHLGFSWWTSSSTTATSTSNIAAQAGINGATRVKVRSVNFSPSFLLSPTPLSSLTFLCLTFHSSFQHR